MKRFICLLMSLIILFIPVLSIAYFEEYESIPTWSNSIETFAQIQNKVELQLDCASAILMDESTGTILYTKNEHEKLRPASVTKVMTLLLIMEALEQGEIKLDDKVPCSERARKMGGSQIWLNENEELTVNDMLKAICVVSANDCCVAMSEFISGSEEAFVVKMNDKAKTLGMNNTLFRNCHGIDEDGHLTTAFDIGIMSRELSKNHPQIHEYTKIWMDTLRDGKSELVNTNKLVRFYSGCTGLKTGSTSLALFNLSATATRNDLKLIAVVLKGTTSQLRFDDAKKLLDFGFANFSNTLVAEKDKALGKVSVTKSNLGEVDAVVANDVSILLAKEDSKNIKTEMIYDENISAPLEYMEKVGVINCYLNDEIIRSENILAGQKVDRKNIVKFFNELIGFSYRLGR